MCKNTLSTIAAIILLFLTQQSFAQDFSNVEIKAEKITENIYMLTGKGGNIVVSVGDDGVFVIDAQYAPLSEKIMAAIRKISDQPLRYVVNTHWHGDHTGGNENFSNAGALLVAHENVRERMSTEQYQQAFRRTVPPANEAALPNITFTEELKFYCNNEEVWMLHLHKAHTDGDAVVFFPKSNVIHMGDIYFNGNYPFIDISSGGTINGMINAVNQVLVIINEATKIIPGHGVVSNKKALSQYRDVLMTLRDRVKKAVDAKMTFEDIQAAKLSADLDEKWGNGFIKPDKIIDIIYTDLSR